MAVTIQHRRDTAANWTSVNPVLAAGQLGFETDTTRHKVGNGSTAWTSLAYASSLVPGDIRRFGGVGNDSAENNTALSNALLAIDATYGGEVFIPSGIFRVTPSVSSTRSNIRIRGEKGAEIKVVGAGNAITLTGDHVEVDGVRFTSTLTTGNPSVAIKTLNASNVTVTNCLFDRALLTARCDTAAAERNFKCTGNTFRGTYTGWVTADNANALYVLGFHNTNISNNIFECVDPERIIKVGLSLYGLTVYAGAEAWIAKRTIINNNIIDVTATTGKQVIDLFTGTYDVTFSGNIVLAAGTWQTVLDFKAGGGTATQSTAFQRGIVISGNVIEASASVPSVFSAQGAWGLSHESGVDTISILSNDIKHKSVGTDGVFNIRGFNFARVSGNTVVRSAGNLARAGKIYNNQITVISDNTISFGFFDITGNATSSGAEAYTKQPESVTVIGNTIDDFDASGALFFSNLTGLEDVTIADNSIRNQTDTGSINGAIRFTTVTIDNLNIHDNTANLASAAKNVISGTPTVTTWRQHHNSWGAGMPSVASATTTTLPTDGVVFNITGTNNITSVTASWAGRQVVLKFAGILTFTDGSNLKLAGNFVTTTDDAITLVCDGTDWIETGRSVN